MQDIESNGDPRYHLPPNEPIITPERAAKGDVFTGPDCPDCGTTGKDKMTKLPCRTCKGRGWVGKVNAAMVDSSDIRFAQVHIRNVLNQLNQCGAIDTQHLRDGQTYEVWQTIFRARQGYRNNPIYAGELAEMRKMLVSDELPTDEFWRLINLLGEVNCKLIEFAIYTKATPHTAWLVGRNQSSYGRAFDTLSRVMERLREEWRARKDENSACAG